MRVAFCYVSIMLQRAWLLILCLIASSLVATATLHAQENAAAMEVSCSGAAHAEADSAPVPADADKGMPHQHGGCHGHAFAVDTSAAVLEIYGRSASQPIAQPSADPSLRAIGPALRPPRA